MVSALGAFCQRDPKGIRMEWRAVLTQSKEQVRKTVKEWSLANYVFNLAVAGIPPIILGVAFKMPWYLQLAVGALGLVTMVSGMILYQAERQDRLSRTARRIRSLAEDINISGLTIQPTFRIGPARDPIKEAGFELRAMVTPDICPITRN